MKYLKRIAFTIVILILLPLILARVLCTALRIFLMSLRTEFRGEILHGYSEVLNEIWTGQTDEYSPFLPFLSFWEKTIGKIKA